MDYFYTTKKKLIITLLSEMNCLSYQEKSTKFRTKQIDHFVVTKHSKFPQRPPQTPNKTSTVCFGRKMREIIVWEETNIILWMKQHKIYLMMAKHEESIQKIH